MGRIPDHLLRLAQRVAEGRWVTIGAKADPKRPGKKKGGTPVELDGEGVIQKGPAALTGKRPSELSQSHLFTGQPHKSQRKLFAEPGDPVPPPRLDPEAKPQAQAPAKKEPKPKAKKPQNMSLLAVIRREGGISGGDFEHADFREHGLLGALNKNGFGIDDMAAMLVRGGHIIVPHGVSSPGDHLLQLLKKKTNSLLADKTSELEKDYEAYARAREEALAHGHESGDLEEVRGRGQEAGANAGTGDILEEIFGPDLGRGGEAGAEEPGDLAGDAAEPASGVDTSFDFGPAAAPKVEEKPKAAKPRKPKQKKDWEDKQEEKHQKALADVKAADAEKAAVAAKARELLGKVTDPGQKAELQKLIDRAEGKQAEPEAPPALDKADDQRPKIGDTIKTRLGGSNEKEQPDFEMNLMPATKPGHFAIGQGSIKQREIPLESFDNFIDDMTGKVSVPADSGVAEIDAVASGKAKHLGRGDDGSAFQVGDKVVKTSTVSPFIPTNPGHRTPQEGLNRLHDQTMTHNKLAEILKDKGVGGVEPLEWHEHGSRGFAVSNLLDTKAKLNAEQIAKVRDTVDAIHDAGYVVGDDIQVGLNKNGDPVIYDLGKARKLSASDREAGYELEHDSSKFTKMAKQNGHEDALPLRSDLVRQIDRLKNSTSKMGEKLRAKFQDQLDQLDAKVAKPSQAPEQKTEDQLRDEYRKAKAARQAADNSDNPEDAFHADDALWNAEQALKKAGLDPAKDPQQSQGPAAPPKLNLFGQTEPTKPQPATTQGLFGEQVPVDDKKTQPKPTAADDAAKGLDWLDQKQDKKTDGTGEMFGGLFSPGQQASQGQQEPVAPPRTQAPDLSEQGKANFRRNVDRVRGATPAEKAASLGKRASAGVGSSDAELNGMLNLLRDEYPDIYKEIQKNPGLYGPNNHALVAAHTGGPGPEQFDFDAEQAKADKALKPGSALDRIGMPPKLDANGNVIQAKPVAPEKIEKGFRKFGPPQKPPHEMTRAEFAAQGPTDKAKQYLADSGMHRGKVQAALDAGQNVPAEVLAEYPGIKKTEPQQGPTAKEITGKIQAETYARRAQAKQDDAKARVRDVEDYQQARQAAIDAGQDVNDGDEKQMRRMIRQNEKDRARALQTIANNGPDAEAQAYADRLGKENERLQAKLAKSAGPVAPPKVEPPLTPAAAKTLSLPDRIKNLNALLNKTRSRANAKALRATIAQLEREAQGSPAPPKVEASKPAHEMTKAEFQKAYMDKANELMAKVKGRKMKDVMGVAGKAIAELGGDHFEQIKKARAAGKAIPQEVLADYPYLKEPHEMTQQEWAAKWLASSPGRAPRDIDMGLVKLLRKADVKRAIDAGKQVPASVLADYPDLKPATESARIRAMLREAA